MALIDSYKSQLRTADPEKAEWLNKMITRELAKEAGTYTGVEVNPNQSVFTDYNYATGQVPVPNYQNYQNITGIAGNVTEPTMVDVQTQTATPFSELYNQLVQPSGTTTAPVIAPVSTGTTTGVTGATTGEETQVSGATTIPTGETTAEATTGVSTTPTTTTGYQSQYANVISDLLGQYLGADEFTYDPTKDAALKQAQADMTKYVMESMNQRGLLNSTLTANQVSQELARLIPEYEALAYERYQQGRTDLYNKLQMVSTLDAQEYQKYIDQYNMDMDTINNERQKVEDAWYRVTQLGYVDNDASIILGVPVGTLSSAARTAKEARDQELADYERQLADEYAMMDYEYQKRAEEAELKYALESAAATTGTETEAATKPTEAQQQYYNQYVSELNRALGLDPLAMYNQVASHPEIINYMGQDLYNELLLGMQDSARESAQAISEKAESSVLSKDATVKEISNIIQDEMIYEDFAGKPTVDKEAVMAYLDERLNNGTLTEEQYNYIVATEIPLINYVLSVMNVE